MRKLPGFSFSATAVQYYHGDIELSFYTIVVMIISVLKPVDIHWKARYFPVSLPLSFQILAISNT